MNTILLLWNQHLSSLPWRLQILQIVLLKMTVDIKAASPLAHSRPLTQRDAIGKLWGFLAVRDLHQLLGLEPMNIDAELNSYNP